MGSRSTSAGTSHSWDRPTRASPQPMATAISVALGSRETMRGARGWDTGGTPRVEESRGPYPIAGAAASLGGRDQVDEAEAIPRLTPTEREIHRLAEVRAVEDEGVEFSVLAGGIDAVRQVGQEGRVDRPPREAQIQLGQV